MLKIGITGQSGFVGSHLSNLLKTKSGVELIPFEDIFFEKDDRLACFASQCDIIIHLAAVNRHEDLQKLYDINIQLTNQLITALEKAKAKPHILFSSSIQEDRDNLYGKSKQECRKCLAEWAERNNAQFTGLIMPNVFGPFGKPYYNSVVATFCHQLVHNEQPKIDTDGLLKLIYVGELAEYMYDVIVRKNVKNVLYVPHSTEIKVSEILQLLLTYKTLYFERGIIPKINSFFELNLFNTFRCYINQTDHFPVKLKQNTDERGNFVETVKLHTGGQVSFSTTKPGITRGNHYHTRKIERFVVLKGNATIQLRKINTEEVIEYTLSGTKPAYVDMPIWYTHNITNTGSDELLTLFWINELFDPEDPDTYFEIV